MTVTVNRAWLVVLYTLVMTMSIGAYVKPPPFSFIPVEVHKAICVIGIVWLFVASTYHALKWSAAFIERCSEP